MLSLNNHLITASRNNTYLSLNNKISINYIWVVHNNLALDNHHRMAVDNNYLETSINNNWLVHDNMETRQYNNYRISMDNNKIYYRIFNNKTY